MILKTVSLASIVFLSMIVIGSADEISVGDGESVSVSGHGSAEGTLVTTDSSCQGSVTSTGSIDELNIDPWVENTKGDYAEVDVTGSNLIGFSYNYNVYPGEGGGWGSDGVSAQQWLAATSVNSLHANTLARNADGDEAHATMDVIGGSIGSYYSGAYAGSDSWSGYVRGAYAQQIANHVTGNDISIQTCAKDANYWGEQAFAKTDVANGELIRYSALGNAVKYWGWYGYGGFGPSAVGVSVDSLSAFAPTGSINHVQSANNYFGDTAEIKSNINRGYLYNSYWDSYAVGDYGSVGAYQSIDASGDQIGFSDKISNQLLGSYGINENFAFKDVKLWSGVSSSFDSLYLDFGLYR